MTTEGYRTQKEPQELKRVRRQLSKRSPNVSQHDACTKRRERLGVSLRHAAMRQQCYYTVIAMQLLASFYWQFDLLSYITIPWSGLSLLRDNGLLLSNMGPYSDMMVRFLYAQRSTQANSILTPKASIRTTVLFHSGWGFAGTTLLLLAEYVWKSVTPFTCNTKLPVKLQQRQAGRPCKRSTWWQSWHRCQWLSTEGGEGEVQV